MRLNTGLFNARDNGRKGWSNQLYPEFLATHNLIKREVPIEQLRSLLFIRVEGKEILIPQLEGISSFLAMKNEVFLQEIMKNSPETFLRSAIYLRDFSPENKSKIINAILVKAKQEYNFSFYDQSIGGQILLHMLEQLSYPELSKQLKTWLESEKNVNALAKKVALILVKMCKVESLEKIIEELVLDPNEPDAIIRFGLEALEAIKDQESKITFAKKLLRIGHTIRDDLKGWAVDILWPNNIENAVKMFSFLSEPESNYVSWPYENFLKKNSINKSTDSVLSDDFLKLYIKIKELHSALKKVNIPRENIYNFGKKYWNKLNNPDTLDKFLYLAISRSGNSQAAINRKDRKKFYEEFWEDYEERRNIFLRLLDRKMNSLTPSIINAMVNNLVEQEDLYWVMFLVKKKENHPRVGILIQGFILSRYFKKTDNVLKLIFRLVEENPYIKNSAPRDRVLE